MQVLKTQGNLQSSKEAKLSVPELQVQNDLIT